MTRSASVARLQGAAKALRNAADMAALGQWPLSSLWEEVAEARARDEWEHLREFAGPLAGPDGGPPASCASLTRRREGVDVIRPEDP